MEGMKTIPEGKLIASYGGGTNSTAMLIALAKRGIVPDHILFADTGSEKEGTYHYIKYFSEWLKNNGLPEIEILRYKTKYGNELTLIEDILNNKTLPGIAFGWKSCSEKFKIRPQHNFIKERYPDESIVQLIGFDASEVRRVKENPLKNYTNIYPLIELGWNRSRCIEEIKSVGLCLPGKSSCFFCPNMKKPEILQLSDEEKRQVRIIELNATNVAELKGLGRSFSWTDLINADEEQLNLFDDLDMYQTPCECID